MPILCNLKISPEWHTLSKAWLISRNIDLISLDESNALNIYCVMDQVASQLNPEIGSLIDYPKSNYSEKCRSTKGYVHSFLLCTESEHFGKTTKSHFLS